MRYGAIDIGTNSCRLLIAEPEERGLKVWRRSMVTTRIGEGVDRHRMISPDALERTVAGLADLNRQLAEYKTTQIRVAATSAVRESANSAEFVERVWQELNWKVEVISGQEEAELSYLGVKRGLPLPLAPLVVDLGGGSTEFMLEDPLPWQTSLPVGAVRATEAAYSDADIKSVLAALPPDLTNKSAPMVAVGGTATSLAAMKMGLKQYDSDLVHGQVLSKTEVDHWLHFLQGMSLAERSQVPGLQPKRADIIVQGIRILSLIMEHLGYEQLLVSESDILDGMIWRMSASQTD